jgi:hypothetical protein
MLIGLGIDVFRRMSRERIHFHVHEHHNKPPHFHAHIHEPQDHHETASSHNHAHPKGFPYRALIVGLMHGMAGSAALIVLTLKTFSLGWDPHLEWAFSHWSWLFPFGIQSNHSVGGTTASKLASGFRQQFLGYFSFITMPTGFWDNHARDSWAGSKKKAFRDSMHSPGKPFLRYI